ncbi:MAG: hypothetical protein FWF81_04640 [Defluviitaleaceae bacterium]|nr:hypothetical protein [Defluviitaleaceae bacterium]
MSRSIAGFNSEAKKSKEAAAKYCQIWQFELTKINTILATELSSKKITQAVYNVKREELKRQNEDLNKCIKLLNTQAK